MRAPKPNKETLELVEALDNLYDQWLDAHDRLKIICGLLELGNLEQAKIMSDHLLGKFEAEKKQLLHQK